jgi:predicted alpha/beta superfamily hydrolase
MSDTESDPGTVNFEEMILDASVPYAMSSEPPLSFRAEGYDYDHEVLVTLPASYSVSPERSYPVLWAMDGALMHMLVAGIVNNFAFGRLLPEMIVVSVGHPSAEGMPGFAKREIDLLPPGSLAIDDDLGTQTEGMAPQEFLDELAKKLKGDQFLDFLIDQLRPALGEQYRMNDDHGLMGHSSGGYFTGYALFARPGGFSRYLIASGTNKLTLELEAKYAESHEDLSARVFIGAGSGELSFEMSTARIVSRTVFLAENLVMRKYPSLVLKSQLYTDRDHFTVMAPMFADGIQHLYADEAEKIAKIPV